MSAPAPARRLLLIGHGYLGQAVAERFRQDAWRVIPVSLSGGEDSLACDVSDPSAVATLPQADAILHCAASGRGGAEAYRKVFVEGCQNLIQHFPETPLLFTSSTSVHAQTDGSLVTESSPTLPDRETGRLLLQAENLVLAAGGTVARLAGLYGPGRSVILRRFLHDEATLEEDGSRYLNQIHRDDAAEALHLLLAGPQAPHPGVFLVADDDPMTQIDCYRWLAAHFHKTLPPSAPRDPNRKRGWSHKRISNQKLRALGWQARYPSFRDAAPLIAPGL
jgi:nucleoside-diphosphate-sugar epimerase